MKKKGMGKRAFAAWLAVMTVAQSNAFAATGNAGGAFLQQGTWIQEGRLISQFFIISFTNPSSKTLPSYFSWSFTTTPMILELFLASRTPAIFG